MPIAAPLVLPTVVHADNLAKDIKKASKHSTLDQHGTKPFDLKLGVAPSFERYTASGRTGEVEMWVARSSRTMRCALAIRFSLVPAIALTWSRPLPQGPAPSPPGETG